jgi:hypothetical protein
MSTRGKETTIIHIIIIIIIMMKPKQLTTCSKWKEKIIVKITNFTKELNMLKYTR